MRRRGESGAGSLDMLLDTMCNTFGGVCFIALLVAILSAMLPKESSSEEDDVRRMAVDETMAELIRTRDELRVAVDLQRDLLETYTTNATSAISAADVVSLAGDKDAEMAKLRKRLLELEEQIRKAMTDTDYNEQEYARLMKLSDELKRKIADFKDARRRTVRTPTERSLPGLSAFDIWLRDGLLYQMNNEEQVRCDRNGFGEATTWDYHCIPGKGYRMDEAFLNGPGFQNVVDHAGRTAFFRIWTDSRSFPELCLLRDELIRRGFKYNWQVTDLETLHFVVGSDTTVQ